MDQTLTSTRRKRLLKQFGISPVGYTHQELEQFLDLLYGMFSFCYSLAERRQIRLSDPFDCSGNPRQMAVIELAEWLEGRNSPFLSEEVLAYLKRVIANEYQRSFWSVLKLFLLYAILLKMKKPHVAQNHDHLFLTLFFFFSDTLFQDILNSLLKGDSYVDWASLF